MTPKLTFGLVIFSLIAALTFSFSSTQIVKADSDKHEHAEGHEVLEHNMKIMGSAFRQLRKDARSKSFNDETLKSLARMQQAAVIAMHANEEEHITKKEDVIAYRSMMADVIKKMLDMEIAILKGENDAAAACVEDMNTLMKNGHSKYKD
jgi:soluble cytochrome b562